MSDFVNTLDVLGDEEVIRSILNKTITEFSDDKLQTLKSYAFYNCDNLLSVNLPNLTSLGLSTVPNTFSYCDSLQTVSLPKLTPLTEGLFTGCKSLKNVVLYNGITTIPKNCFNGCKSLTFDDTFFSKIKIINSGGFRGCNSLSEVNLPLLTSLGSYAFGDCTNLKQISIPLMTEIAAGVFSRSGIESFDFSKITSIGDSGFSQSAIQNIDAPLLKTIGNNAFSSCQSLQTASALILESISYGGFNECSSLKSINFPELKSVGGYGFNGCSSLESINCPNLASVTGQNVFAGCTSLKEVYLPKVTSLDGDSSYMFCNCSSLEKVTFDEITLMSASNFKGCTNLTSLIIKSPQMCNLSGSFYDGYETSYGQTLYYFPKIVQGTGYVYVPSTVIGSYKTDKQWGIYASQIKSIDRGVSFNSRKDFLLYNSSEEFIAEFQCAMDEENISITSNNVSVTTDNESIATVNNISVVDNIISFNVNTLAVAGDVNIIVKVNIDGNEYLTSTLLSVFEEIPEVTYTVEAVDGATYGFSLNADEYYESTNKGVNSSYSICKLSFFANGINNIYLDCINSGEANYDYGIISNIDTTLTLSSTADSNALKSFKGLASTSVQTVDLGVPESGEHFIYIKYIKDSSSNNGNDSLQFKVRVE